MLTAPLQDSQSAQILCYYTNRADQPQIVKVCEPVNSSFERVVLPQQSILFQAKADSQLEIYSTPIDPSRVDQIPCDRLRASKEMLSHLLLRVL